MKYLLFLLSTLLLCIKTTFALDPPPRPDSIVWGSYQTEILHAPVITGGSQPITILPNSQQICFDKQLTVKLLVNGQLVEQCLYLNTTDGLIGHLKPKRSGGISLCDIKPDDVDFSFFIYGLKGNTYHYFTRKPKTQIEHYVSTSNSQTYLYQATLPAGSNTAVLHKKSETRMYCNDKIKGKAYKFDGGMQTWFIFGREYPETLTWEAYFGNFGVGYLKTDKGLYIIMEMEVNGNSFKITSLEDVHTCFNPQPFQVYEDQFYVKRRQDLDKERQKLNEEQAKLGEGTCQGERADLYNFKVEELNKQEQNLENSMVGNSMQNLQTQQALLGMFDAKEILKQTILETKVSICKKEDYISKHPDDPNGPDKLSCLQNFLGQEESTLAQMESLEIQYASNPGQAYALKTKKYWDLMKTADNCN